MFGLQVHAVYCIRVKMWIFIFGTLDVLETQSLKFAIKKSHHSRPVYKVFLFPPAYYIRHFS